MRTLLSRPWRTGLLVGLLGLSWSGLHASSDKPLITEEDLYSELPFTLSATRLSQAIKDSPVSITVIDRDMIEAYDPQELIDVLRLVPGFQVVHPRGYRVSTAYHGLGTEYAQRMQVLIDGRSVYSPMFGHVQWLDLPLEVEDVERIEVTRGPNAASYGANAFTATINIITRHPVDTHGAYFKVINGARATQRYMTRFGGGTDKLDYRFSISQRSDNGFDDDEFPDDKRINSLSFRGDYQADLDNNFQFQFGFSEKEHRDGDTDADDILVDPPRDVETRTNFQFIKWRHQVDSNEEFSLQFYHNFEQISDDFLTAPIDDILPGFSAFVTGFTGVPTANEQIALSNSHRAHRYDLEFQHTIEPRNDLRLVWGASARLDQVGAKGFFSQPSNRDYYNNHTYRLFAHSEWRPSPAWTINAGLMVENNDLTGTDLSPRLAVNHHFTDNHTLRAGYSRALRTPSILEENADSASRLSDGRELEKLLLSTGDLRPEKITSLELAYIGRFPQYGVDVDVKLFYDRIRNVLNQYEDEAYNQPINALVGFPLSTRVLIFDNDGFTNIKGLEAQLKYDLSRGTRVHLGYTILDVDGRSLSDINESAVIGDVSYNEHEFEAPRTISTLQLIQDIDHDLRGSVAFHRYSRYEFGGGDSTGDFKILNWRLAKKFRSGNASGQVALSFQNMLDEYFDFEREQEFESRVFLSLELGFH
jgi:iron complex outermembrane receptor protein